jgi:Ca2+:H+ antiporter
MNGGDSSHIKEQKPGVCAGGAAHYVQKSVSALFFSNYLNLLMLCTPFAGLAYYGGGSDGLVFTFSLLAIAPFAERLSYVTEQLALYTNETLGGLLNATFGNVTELIVSLFALRVGMLRIVQVSLLGSILSNMLLVLGCAFFFGGLRFREQTFNKSACSLNSGLLMLSVMSLLFPMVLDVTHSELSPDSVLQVSRAVSLIMLFTYCCYLVFQLHTHRHLFEDQKEEPGDGAEDDDDEDEEEAVLGLWGSIFWLGVITVFISFLSEFMVDALEVLRFVPEQNLWKQNPQKLSTESTIPRVRYAGGVGELGGARLVFGHHRHSHRGQRSRARSCYHFRREEQDGAVVGHRCG